MDFGEPFGGVIPGARGAVLSVLLRTGVPLTGREVHRLVGNRHSLWSVQEALKGLAVIGIVQTTTVGRAGVHTINEQHAAVGPLRALVDPLALLGKVIAEAVDPRVESVILFGSIARGDARPDSDVDLAVIHNVEWEGSAGLEDAVRTRMGNDCDVLVFSRPEFEQLARSGEPVVTDILRDGVVVIGPMPRVEAGVEAGIRW